MTIILTIDNVDALPDGGPLRYQARAHGFEIGREHHLDWTLPDPARYISGRHCEIRYEKGDYWLYDVSRNGTFLNGSSHRVKSPCRLADGDRLAIGHYIIKVELEPESGVDRQPKGAPDENPIPGSAVNDIWDTGAAAPLPVDRRDFMPERPRSAPDPSDQFIDFSVLRQSGPHLSPQRGHGAAEQPVSQRSPGRPPNPFEPAVEPPAGRDPFLAGESFPAPRPAHPAGSGIDPLMQQVKHSADTGALRSGSGPAMPASRFVEALGAGAGVPADVFSGRDPSEVGREIGEFLKTAVENLAQLLKARAAAKAMTKSSSRTMISAVDNNPLKFIPSAAEVIEIMFARKRPGYLDAKQSVEEAFADLKRHELATYAAMQKALARLLDELAPDTIESKVGNSAFPLKKGRAWDLFVTRWEERSANENGMLDVFLAYFAEAYDEANQKK